MEALHRHRGNMINSVLVACILLSVPVVSAGGARQLREYQESPPPVDYSSAPPPPPPVVYTSPPYVHESSPPVYHSPPPPAPYTYSAPPKVTETCSAAPKEFIDKLLYARRQDCEPIAAECKKVAVARGISDTNCEDCKRKCLNPPHQITETCSAAPAEFIEKLLNAKREDCESIAAECKKVALYQGISDTNCEDCKRKCLNPPTQTYPSPPIY
ncbi:hypothetical protein Mapa_013498 [Marchantia paleacea]|nr:hypothetical protein Mapa_013498 [Marchantia paleacea]